MLACGAVLLQVDQHWTEQKEELYKTEPSKLSGRKRSYRDQCTDCLDSLQSGNVNAYMLPASTDDSMTADWTKVTQRIEQNLAADATDDGYEEVYDKAEPHIMLVYIYIYNCYIYNCYNVI